MRQLLSLGFYGTTQADYMGVVKEAISLDMPLQNLPFSADNQASSYSLK